MILTCVGKFYHEKPNQLNYQFTKICYTREGKNIKLLILVGKPGFQQMMHGRPSPSRVPWAKVRGVISGLRHNQGFINVLLNLLCTEFEPPFYKALLTRATLYNFTSCRLQYIPETFLCQYELPGVVWVSSSSTAFACWATVGGPSSAHSPALPPSGSSPGTRGLCLGSLRRGPRLRRPNHDLRSFRRSLRLRPCSSALLQLLGLRLG